MKYWRIIKFTNRSQTADMLPSQKLTGTNKLMLFTTEQKAGEYIKQVHGESKNWGLFGIYPDEFLGKVTARYVIDPELQPSPRGER
jgi:hypothetical protein